MIFELEKMEIKKKEKCNIKKQNFKTEKTGSKTNREKKEQKGNNTWKKWTCPFAFILLFRFAFMFCFYCPFCFAFFPVKNKLNAK